MLKRRKGAKGFKAGMDLQDGSSGRKYNEYIILSLRSFIYRSLLMLFGKTPLSSSLGRGA